MAARDGCSSLGFWLLQPELMTVEELKELLLSRCVALETLKGMDKDMLIDLYRRVVLPLPQRENSRCRTKSYSKKRQTISAPGMSSKGCSFTIGFNGDVDSITATVKRTSFKVAAAEERLKAPPGVGDVNKKIKLNKSNSDLDSIIIVNRRRSSQSTEERSSDSSTSGKTVVDSKKNDHEKDRVNGSEPPKKVTLKRTFSQQLSSTTTTIKSEDATPDKKRRAKITWP